MPSDILKVDQPGNPIGGSVTTPGRAATNLEILSPGLWPASVLHGYTIWMPIEYPENL